MQTAGRERLVSIDALRGIVMIIMPLDHVRDFFHAAAMTQLPTDMATTTPATFLTRWITHFCAPVFLFTAGMGAYLRFARGSGSKAELSQFLLSRGAWLILLELIAMRFALDFGFAHDYPVLLITLWALGGSMILLAGLIQMPLRALAAICAAIIALHNLTDNVDAASFGKMAWLWNMLHQPGGFTVAGIPVAVGYPLLPLTATMGAGYCAAHLYQGEGEWRRRLLRRAGIALTAAFVLVRAINIYGDPFPWSVQRSGVMTVLSFLNCTKYPASLDFLLMTMGPALIVLAWLDRMQFGERNPLLVFGRVPLFFFLVHFYWIHVLLVMASWIRYGPAPFLFRAPPSAGGPAALFPAHFGYSLWVVYAVWGFVLVTMYPVCRWFMGVKKRRRDWWLSYL